MIFTIPLICKCDGMSDINVGGDWIIRSLTSQRTAESVVKARSLQQRQQHSNVMAQSSQRHQCTGVESQDREAWFSFLKSRVSVHVIFPPLFMPWYCYIAGFIDLPNVLWKLWHHLWTLCSQGHWNLNATVWSRIPVVSGEETTPLPQLILATGYAILYCWSELA